MLLAAPPAFLQSLFWPLSISKRLQRASDGGILAWIWPLLTVTGMELPGKKGDDKKAP